MIRCWAVVGLALALLACGGTVNQEQRILETMDALEAHGEAGERGPFMDYLAPDFRAQGGSYDREAFHQLLLLQWNRYQRIHVQRLPETITLTGPESARAEFRALLTGGRGLLPENGQVYDIQTFWALENGDWLLVAVDWSPVLNVNP